MVLVDHAAEYLAALHGCIGRQDDLRVVLGRPLLAARLQRLRGQRVVVLGLPRGGVPVAFEVARALGAPLDVIVVRKLGVPFQAELGMGAIGEDGVRVLNQEIIQWGGISADEPGCG